MKRNFFYWRPILSVSILPVLAIAPSLIWNQPARAQQGEKAGLIHASISRQGMKSLADSESRLKPTEILTHSSFEKTSAMRQGFQPLSDSRLLAQSVPPSSIIRQGRQVSLNGRILPLSWTQQPANSTSGNFRTWIADVGLMQSAGVDLLSSADSAKQPVQWFSVSLTADQSLAARATGSYRYLDVTDFARLAGWEISADGNILKITSQTASVTGIRQAEIESGDRIVVDLDRPTPWQVNFVDKPSPSPTPTPNPPDDPTKPAIPLQNLRTAPNLETPDDPTKPGLPLPITPAAPIAGQEWSIAIDAKVDTALLQDTFQISKQLLSLKVEPDGAQTKVKVKIPLGWRPQVFSLGNPNRLVIDIRPDSLVEKNIVWAPGVQWRQQYQNLGTARFPVVWLEVNPRQPGVKIRPILSNPPTDQGTAPLLQTAEISGAAAAINAGFFNRINRLALGAIRGDNKWLSGPILNRGAIAWNDRGEFAIDRLTLQETVITPANQFLPVSHLNSAYVQSGIGRYTPDWGTTYTPLSANEIVVTVAGDSLRDSFASRVVSQSPGGATGTTIFPIPANGYILALRSDLSIAPQFTPGTLLRLQTNTFPADFNRFPYILGGGPMLVKNSRVVLDAKAEGFSDAYVRQTAIRSAIGRNAAGNLLIVAVHNRVGGAGPNFAELAQILQQMGAVEALNLDGGSSTSLYLGGSLLDRPASTAARVHNAIGIFIQP
ncbi:phosphodiester glycosidase family protein [Microcoleus sp. S13_B4]|uniref:phosphodiester glycosidase family protein n=1 Tax=Microcoleus sp. S13_B4 TaxID=3055408 RepID=UPI002FD2E59E